MVGRRALDSTIEVRILASEQMSRESEGYDTSLSRMKKGFNSPTRRNMKCMWCNSPLIWDKEGKMWRCTSDRCQGARFKKRKNVNSTRS